MKREKYVEDAEGNVKREEISEKEYQEIILIGAENHRVAQYQFEYTHPNGSKVQVTLEKVPVCQIESIISMLKKGL